MTSWGGVIVTPGSKAYEKTEEKPAAEEQPEVMDSEESSDVTAEEKMEETPTAATK